MGDIGNIPVTVPATLNWVQAQHALLAPFAGIPLNRISSWSTDFEISVGFSVGAPVGTGAATKVNAGTLYQMTTGATAGSTIDITNGLMTIANPKTTRWFLYTRAQITSATDAQALVRVCMLNGGAGDRALLRVTNAQLVISVLSGSTETATVTSWVVDLAAPHDFGLTFDGTTITALVDGVVVGSSAVLTNMPTIEVQPDVAISNGTTATARTMNLYAMGLGVQMP